MSDFEDKSPDQNSEEDSTFEYTLETPPSLEVLESKIFVVHATSALPLEGVIKAGTRDISYDKSWGSEEPPSFRPTIHFSLGELVQPHDDQSWDDQLYAVVSPLREVEDHLINISPYDTFTLGNLPLNNGMTLLVPEGTDLSSLQSNIEVKTYNQKIGLRKAVDATISEKGGWSVKMQNGKTNIEAPAKIKDVEINNSKFFSALFEKYPDISFGNDIRSERGEAFRFGSIGLALNFAIRDYLNSGAENRTLEVYFNKAFITHHLECLEKWIGQTHVGPDDLKVFEEKKEKVMNWLNVIDADLTMRRVFRRTLAGAPESIQREIFAKRGSLVELNNFLSKIRSELPLANNENTLYIPELAGMLSSMPLRELLSFKEKNEVIFDYVNLPEFYFNYSIKRWLVVKNDQAIAEGLDLLLETYTRQLSPKSVREVSVSNLLEDYLYKDSNRLNEALTILKNPVIREYMAKSEGVVFEGEGPNSLLDVIKAFPWSKVLFENSEDKSFSEEQIERLELIEKIDDAFGYNNIGPEVLDSFVEAFRAARGLSWKKELLKKNLEEIDMPLSFARDQKDIRTGMLLSIYEVWRRDLGAEGIWEKLGLIEEYRKVYKSDSEFWSSKESFVEVYKILKNIAEDNGHI